MMDDDDGFDLAVPTPDQKSINNDNISKVVDKSKVVFDYIESYSIDDDDDGTEDLAVLAGGYEQTSATCVCKYVLIHPHSKEYRAWETLVHSAIVANCLISTFKMSFSSNGATSWVVAYGCDVVCVVNVILSFYVTHIDKNGMYVTNCDTISRQYLRRMFVWDVLSVLPTDLFVLVPGFPMKYPTWKMIATLRTNRLIGLHKVFGFTDMRQNELDSNASLWLMVKALALMLFVLHLPTCVWYLLACSGFHNEVACYCYNHTWAQKTGYVFECGKQLNSLSENVNGSSYVEYVADSYVISMYWTVTTALTVGFGDVSAANAAEEAFSMLTMLLGLTVIYGVLLGGMSSILTNSLSQGAMFSHRIAVVKLCLNDRNVPLDTVNRIISFYKYIFLQKRYHSVKYLFDILPMILKLDFQYSKHRMVFDESIFRDATPAFKRMLSLYIKEKMYLPGQIMTRRLEIGHEMFYIIRGEAQVLNEDDETPLIDFKEGKLFGENMKRFMDMQMSLALDARGSAGTLGNMRTKLSIAPFQVKTSRFSSFIDFIFKKKAQPLKNTDATQSASRKGTTIHPGTIDQTKLVIRLRAAIKWLRHKTFQSDSRGYRIWEVSIVVISIISAIMHTTVACFSSATQTGYFLSPVGRVLLVITYLLDFVLFLDLLVTFRVSVSHVYGITTDTVGIFQRYFKHIHCALDVLAILPIEWFSFCIHADIQYISKLFAFLKFNRLLKLYRVSIMFDRMEESLDFSNFMKQALKMFIYTMLLCHFSACWFYATACFMSRCYDGSWFNRWSLAHNRDMNNTETLSHDYILTLYYAVVVMTSTGYGDISGSEMFGFVTTIVVEITGVVVFAYTLALLSATIANMDTPRTQFQERLFAIMVFMKNHNLSEDLQKRVVQYFTILWQQYRGIWFPGEPGMFSDLPLSLQNEANIVDIFRRFSEIPLFQDLPDNFINDICVRVVPYLFSPGEIISHTDNPSTDVNVINRGICQKLSRNHKFISSELRAGEYFGSLAMLFNQTLTGTICAKTYCEVFTLKDADLFEVLSNYPTINRQFDEVRAKREQYEELLGDSAKKMANLTDSNRMKEYKGFAHDKPSVRSRWWRSGNLGIANFSDKPSHHNLQSEYKMPFKHRGRVGFFLSCLLLKYTILPDGMIARWTTIAITAIGMFLVFLTPLHASFFHQSMFAWTLAYAADALVVVYIFFVALHTAYYNEHNIIVYHPLSTASHYLRSNFVTDLLCVIPLEIIVLFVLRGDTFDVLHVMAFVRYNRLIHFYRYTQAWKYLEADVHRDTGLLRLVRFALNIVVVKVLLTCTLFSMACPPVLTSGRRDLLTVLSGHSCKPGSWITSRATNPPEEFDLSSAHAFELFTRSLYFASTTLATLGYGDYSAQNYNEMWVLVVIILVGQLFYTYLMASITASITNNDAARARFTERVANAKRYILLQELDFKLYHQVVNHYEYIWMRTKGVVPRTMFDCLPQALWGSVAYSLYEDIISLHFILATFFILADTTVQVKVAISRQNDSLKCLSKISLFNNAEPIFVRALSKCIRPIYFLRGEYIVRNSDIGTRMYFISRGSVEVLSETGTVYDTLSVGEAFGELAVLYNTTRTASVRAQVNTDLFMLSKADLFLLMERYPSIKPQIYRIASERLAIVISRRLSMDRPGLSTSSPLPDDSSSTGELFTPLSTMSPESNGRVVSDASFVSVNPSAPTRSLLEKPAVLAPVDRVDVADDFVFNKEDPKSFLESGHMDTARHSQGMIPLKRHMTSEIDLDLSDVTIGKKDPFLESFSLAEYSATPTSQPRRKSLSQKVRVKLYALHPNNRAVRWFQSCMCFLTVVSCSVIAFTAAFQQFNRATILTVYIIQGIFIVEMLLRLFIAYYDEYGNLIEDLTLVRRHYISRLNGLPLDMFSVFPFEIFALFAPAEHQMEVYSYIRLLHLFRIIRVRRFFNERSQELNEKMLVPKLISIAVTFLLTIHVFTCIWYVMTCPYRVCHNPTFQNMLTLVEDEMANNWPPGKVFASYCTALYWTVTLATSTGYGDILPMSPLQMWYSVFVMTFFKVQIGFMLGDVTSAFASNESERVAFQQKLDTLKEQMQSQRVSKPMTKRMLKYCSYIWTRNKGINLQSLFSDLPLCLQTDIALSVCRPMLERIPFLMDVNDGFLRMASVHVQHALFGPGEYVVHMDDLAQEIYYIRNGKAAYVTSDKIPKTIRRLKQGQVFGDIGTLIQSTYRASVRTSTHVELLSIAWSDLIKVLVYYPAIKQRAFQHAVQAHGVEIDALRMH